MNWSRRRNNYSLLFQAVVSKLEKAIGQIPLPTGEVARASGPGEGYHIY